MPGGGEAKSKEIGMAVVGEAEQSSNTEVTIKRREGEKREGREARREEGSTVSERQQGQDRLKVVMDLTMRG